MRTMYDSVNANNIPKDAEMVAGYINGRYKWTDADWKRFTKATLVRIQVYIPGGSWTGDGDVLDVEAKDAVRPEAQAVARQWVGLRMAQGKTPCIYTSKDTAKFLRFDGCDYWLADYTGAPHLLPNTVATQYKDPGPFDLSLVRDDWPRIDKSTQSPPVSGSYRGRRYMFVPIHVSGTDGDGNAYWDMPNTNAALVVNAVGNPADPQASHSYKLPAFVGALQIDTTARLVWRGGAPNLGGWDARVVVDV